MRIYRKATHRAHPQMKEAADTLRQPLSFISREMVSDVFDSQLRGRKDIACCFTGHRVISTEMQKTLTARLDALLECMYQKGYRDFISGAALGFDTLAAERVLTLKAVHSDVRLVLAIPCATQSGKWSAADCGRYERLVYAADDVRVLSGSYYEGCMHVRNRFMVDNSSFCICYLEHMRGGTMATVAYAMNHEVPVLNVAMGDACEAFCRG